MQRNNTSLAEILNGKINYYLGQDNPKPEGFFGSVGSLFSARGGEGRERANNYAQAISKYQIETALLKKVYNDLVNDDKKNPSVIADSTKLRQRLWEGLCLYFGITPRDIKDYQRQVTVGAYQGVGVAYGGGVSVGMGEPAMRYLVELAAKKKGIELKRTAEYGQQDLRENIRVINYGSDGL